MQAFLGPPTTSLRKAFSANARNQGVYLQLARLLPLEDGRTLEQQGWIDYAADSQDRPVSDYVYPSCCAPQGRRGTPSDELAQPGTDGWQLPG